jgi:hypothetical protein
MSMVTQRSRKIVPEMEKNRRISTNLKRLKRKLQNPENCTTL